MLGLGTVAEREVYAALDWLVAQQPRIEAGLARRHLKDGTLVLYDVSSSYFEGRKCPLAQLGYSRDHRSDRRRLSTACCARATACRSQSRCSRAVLPGHSLNEWAARGCR